MYRTRQRIRPALGNLSPDKTSYARYGRAFLGLGTPHLENRMGMPDRSLLGYIGLLAGQARSMPGLRLLLSDHFGVPVSIIPFVGRWLHLDDSVCTKLGQKGANNELGLSAVLGTRAWDNQGHFAITVGPICWEDFQRLLPNGRGFGVFCHLTRFYVGEHLDFDILLDLRKEQRPGITLQRRNGTLLGWTSWLGPGAPPQQGTGTVRLNATRWLTKRRKG